MNEEIVEKTPSHIISKYFFSSGLLLSKQTQEKIENRTRFK